MLCHALDMVGPFQVGTGYNVLHIWTRSRKSQVTFETLAQYPLVFGFLFFWAHLLQYYIFQSMQVLFEEIALEAVLWSTL